MAYVPLHVHSVYSGYESLLSFPDLIARCSFLGFRAVGVTDHWSTYGHIEFAEAARRAGIKPVFGAELRHPSLTGGAGAFQLTLLAENDAGYRNLCSLVSLHASQARGGSVTAEDLAAHREGIVALTGSGAGETSVAVLHGNLGRARDAIGRIVEIFGAGNVFVELMNHNTPEESLVAEQLAVLAGKAGVPAVVTNNARYAVREDAEYYRIMRLLAGKGDGAEGRAVGQEYYLKRERDLAPLFSAGADAFERSGEIADRCTVQLPRPGRIAFSAAPNPDEALGDRCRRRFKLAFHNRPADERAHLSRLLERELASARSEDIAGFLLFLRNLFASTAQRSIWIEITGSPLLESLVAHLLDVAPLNPADHDLVFESFSPARPGTPPPVEIVTSAPKKEELVGLIGELLPGATPVHQSTREEMSIATIAKQTAEALEVGDDLREELARVLSFERRHRTLAGLLESSPAAQRLYTNDARVKSALHAAYALQGKLYHTTLDTSRIVILPRALEGFVSFVQGPSGDRFAEIGPAAVEASGGWTLGIQHSHFLGAVAETIEGFRADEAAAGELSGANAWARARWMPPTLDDPHVYALIASGETDGIYLLESQGIRDHLARIKPSTFEELVNVISLYRPGPMEGRLYEKYVDNAEKKGKVYLPHSSLASFLAGTRGVLLYREQVREIIEEIAGMRGGAAAAVERALRGRASGDLMSARLAFMRGAMNGGTNEEDAQRVFEYLLHNIPFTLSKALSCAQASMSYRTAYLRAHAFERYFTALLNCNLGVRDREKRYLQYLREKKVPVLPFGINADAMAFSYEDGVIRAPLQAVVPLEKGEWEAIVEERIWKGDFASFSDFLERMNRRVSEKAALELVEAGVFDEDGASRQRLRLACESYYRAGDVEPPEKPSPRRPPPAGRRARLERQTSLFDAPGDGGDGGGAAAKGRKAR